MKAAAVALICVSSAACSTAGGKPIAQSGGYRTGAVGTALSNAADRGPSELARVQGRLRPESRRAQAQATRADRARTGAAATRSADRPQRAARAAAQTPLDALRAQAGRTEGAGTVARPTLQEAVAQPGALAERALTNQTILAPALAESARVSAGAARAAAPVNRALAGWSLSRPQLGVLAIGLLLAMLAAAAAAWSAGRRRRRMLAEPRIAPPVAANDMGASEPLPTRPTGPQYLLPLSPAGAPPRTYSMKTGGTAKLTSAPRR